MTRFSKKHVIYFRLCCDFLSYTFLLFLFLLSLNNPEVEDVGAPSEGLTIIRYIFIGVYFLALIISVIYRILYYKYSFYEFKDNQVFTTRGVIFKRKSFLDYSKIHSVNKKQSFIQKIFKVSTLLIDSGSTNTAYKAEISIFEDDDKVNELMKLIDYKQNNEPILANSLSFDEKHLKNTNINQEEVLYTYNSKNKVLEIVFTSLSAFFGLFLTVCICISFYIVPCLLFKIMDMDTIIVVLMSCAIFLSSVLAFTFLGGLIGMFIGYYDFKIFKENDNINISYGLLQKNFNKFKISKVRAVIIKQSLIKRLFNYCTVDVEVIGYGDEGENNKVNRVLIPLCKENHVEELIYKILPNYESLKIDNRCKSYFSLFSYHLLFTSLILGIPYLMHIPYLISYNLTDEFFISSLIFIIVIVILFIIYFVFSKFKYHVQGVNVDDKKITIYNGALNKVKTTILKENLIGITKITTSFRRKKGIYSFVIHFKSNSKFNTVKVNCIDESVGDKILNLITF